MTNKSFSEYNRIEAKDFRDTLLKHTSFVKKSIAERARHQRQYGRRVNETQMQMQEGEVDRGKALDADAVVTKSSGTESEKLDTSSRSGNDTHDEDADIKPMNDKEPMAEDAKQYRVKSPLLDDELFKMKDMVEKEDAPEFCEFFKINELKAQLQAKNTTISKLKKHIKKVHETSNEAKVKNDIDVINTINIELEHTVAKLLAENEQLHKENEHLKQTYKDLYDSIKKTRVQTKDHTDSLIVQLKKRESAFAKPCQVIACSESRNSSKNMPRFSSNDMVHNQYLDEAKKKTQERDRKSKTSVMPSAKLQNTFNSSKPKPRDNNQTNRNWPTSKSSCVTITTVPVAKHSRNSGSFSDSKHFVCSTCQKCVFNANHDACITKFLNKVNSRAKVQSHKTRKSNKPIEPKSHTQKPGRQIVTGHRFSPNKSSTVHEKTNNPRSCLTWKATGRIFKTVGLRWIPTGKLFASSTTNVDSEPPHASNADISNPHECIQTLDISAGTLNLDTGTSDNVKKDNLRVWLLKRLMSKNQVS
ncbi:hypothetical protein Tco_0606954 [Tanacetum coccineum]